MRAHTILYVREQARARVFWEAVLGHAPTLDVPGMIEFELSPDHVLGLMPEAGIQRLLGVLPADGPRTELYLIVDDPDAHLQRAVAAGADLLSPLAMRDWGDEVAYCRAPDGVILGLARRSR